MPKYKIIKPGVYQYKCECGKIVTFETDKNKKPKKLFRCWDCTLKYENDKKNC